VADLSTECALRHAAGWARERAAVRALGLVGSRARGTARPGSDVDLVVLADAPVPLGELGGRLVDTRPRGVLTEHRLALDEGLELDIGVAPTSWASLAPLDAGTARIARDGLRVLHDPDGLLGALAAAAPGPPARHPELARPSRLSDGAVALRAPGERDLPARAALGADPEIARWTQVPPGGVSLERARTRLNEWEARRRDGVALLFTIADAETDEMLGAADLWRERPDPTVGEAGYLLLAEARGRGVATRALRLLAGWALRELAMTRVDAFVDPANARSVRVLEGAGFTRDGFLRGLRGPGEDRDVYGLLRTSAP
jgi:RimJ/RimL family protein N-acetyltransferase